MINTSINSAPSPQDRNTRISDQIYITMLVAMVAIGLFLVASVMVPNFFQVQNMLNLVTNNWAVISLGVGVSFLLISGNFDLSVGGIVALSGVLSVWFAKPRLAPTRLPGWPAALARYCWCSFRCTCHWRFECPFRG